MWTCPNCHREFPSLSQKNTYLRITCVCGAVTEIGGEAVPPFTPSGPGTELKSLFAELKVFEKAACFCAAMAAEMDKLGPAGCREHRDRLLTELRKNASLYSAWEKAKAGLTALRFGYPLTLEGLFDLAISRAEALTDPSPRL